MNKNQRTVVDWLSNAGRNFICDIAELEGGYDSVPDDVHEAFLELSDREMIEVIKKSASNLLKKNTA